jgi:serine/threonine protein kinase
MGVVYRAREAHSGRLVALKMMQGAQTGSPELQRFLLEARATGQLSHPGIVAIHAWGEHEGRPYYTMDFVPGQPLSRLIEKGPMPCDRAVKYLVGISRAVAAAHAVGIVHRDLKPGNIIIDAADQPRILDFGLAKRQSSGAVDLPMGNKPLEVLPLDEPTSLAAPPKSNTPTPLTEKGAILGTPAYMAPEQVRAEHDRIGPEADVHALGAIFHEMLTGAPPFRGESNFDILMQVLNTHPAGVRASNPRVPHTLDALCRRCLAKPIEDRYSDAGILADDLERRWHRTTQVERFAKLTLWAALLALLLCVVQLLIYKYRDLDPSSLAQSLAEATTREGILRETAILLARLAEGLALTLTPLAAGVAGFTWLAAWINYSDRPGRLCLSWFIGAVVGLSLWLVADLPFAHPGEAALAWLTMAVPVVVLGSLVIRRNWAPKSASYARPAAGDSYLQKLLGSRTNMQSAPTSDADRHPASLAEFEQGKELHAWESGRVTWGRQPSLDRPVLIWMHRAESSSDMAGMGVVVRHPFVLNLHAIGQGPEGRFLVTEGAAATPLAILLQRGPFMPVESVTLAIRLARALGAFHAQGACHGRLRPEWVLVRGELEPVLCPCGVPSSFAEDQGEDVRALGKLLADWLPRRGRGWPLLPQAGLYRVCDAARGGAYQRAEDLATDLEKSVHLARLRRRMRGANILALVVLVGPLLMLAGLWMSRGAATDSMTNGMDRATLITGLLVALCPSAVVVGFTQFRFWIQRRRLHLSRVARGRIGVGGTLGSLVPLGLIGTLGIVVGVLAAKDAEGVTHLTASISFALFELAGFWFLGGFLAGLSIGVDVLLHSLPGRLSLHVPTLLPTKEQGDAGSV